MDLKVAVTLAPGDETGTRKILAKAEDKLPVHVGLDVNNFGFFNISRYRFGDFVGIGNVSVDSSVLTVNGIIGNHLDQLSYIAGAYSVPVNEWGTRLIVSRSYSQFEVGNALAVLGINSSRVGRTRCDLSSG